jgi:YidC/Oxa1 family membrane protein insertase
VISLALIGHPAAVLLAKSGGITLDPIAKPIAAVLAFFYGLVPNYAAAIVLLTVAVMIILSPLTIKQTRSMLVMQKLQPEMKRLQEEHKNDRQALNEAVMALYKEHNASPLGGCLPMLLPFPVFIALFRVLERLTQKVNGVVTPHYLTASTQMYRDIVKQGGTLKSFGMDLAKSASNVNGAFINKLPYFIFVLLMVGTQYYQQRQLTSRNPQAAQGQQAQIMKFFPLMFGVFAIRFPAGVIVYWTVSNAIRIFQQWAMYRYDPKVKALVEADIKEVEAKTREIGDKPPTGRARLRDLLGGASNPSADPKSSPKPGRAGGRPGGTKPTGAKPTGPKASGAKPTGMRPASGKPPTGKPPTGKPPTGKPATGRANSAGGRPQPPAAKPTQPDGNKPETGKTQLPAGAKPSGESQTPIGATRPGGTNGLPSSPKSDNGGSAGDSPPKGTPRPQTSDAPDGSNGAPRGRTGAGGARTGGNRGKRSRRGR